MGQWLATVHFPDGTVRYGTYSTVIGAVGSTLYSSVCRPGEMLSSGGECHRAQPDGDPLPSFRDRPLAAIDDLVLVVIETDLDDERWYAVHCPNRGLLLGPLSELYGDFLEFDYAQVRDEAGLRHLCGWEASSAVCGRDLTGRPRAARYAASRSTGKVLPDPPPVPGPFPRWEELGLCRHCFVTWLSTSPELAEVFVADPPRARPPSTPVPRRPWWRLRAQP